MTSAPPSDQSAQPAITGWWVGPELAPVPGRPAPLALRLLARIVDLIIMVSMGLGLVIVSYAMAESFVALLIRVLGLLLVLLYDFVLTAAFGQTVGKKLFKLRVVLLSGEPVTWSASALRSLPWYVASNCTLGLLGVLTLLSPVFDREHWHRGWPDKLAKTVVVHQS